MFAQDMQIETFDPALAVAIDVELRRQENHASPRALQAAGTGLTNKYTERYLGQRDYGGHLTHGAKVNFSGRTYHAVPNDPQSPVYGNTLPIN